MDLLAECYRGLYDPEEVTYSITHMSEAHVSAYHLVCLYK